MHTATPAVDAAVTVDGLQPAPFDLRQQPDLSGLDTATGHLDPMRFGQQTSVIEDSRIDFRNPLNDRTDHTIDPTLTVSHH
jgi:hypothetical protein